MQEHEKHLDAIEARLKRIGSMFNLDGGEVQDTDEKKELEQQVV